MSLAETDQPLNVAIIGGGFCGILTAINLLQDAEEYLHIHIVNSEKKIACGVAYDPHTSNLLLNVPNGNMGAFPDKPGHFLQWLTETNNIPHHEREQLAGEFSTRKIYGQYLSQLWRDELDKQGYNKRIWVYNDKAVNIIEKDDELQIITTKYPEITADIVILATGNDQPNFAAGLDLSLKTNPCYFGDPWKNHCIENVNPEDDILVIGNGLTMVDTVLGLVENGCKQTIHTISPHGYRLKPWRDAKEPYVSEEGILDNTSDLTELVSIINKHRKLADKHGQSIYPVIDSLRPKIQNLWQSFTMDEKYQFLKKLSAFWDRVRHRLPTQMHNIIEDMRSDNKLVTHKGSVLSAMPKGDKIEVILNSEGATKPLTVQRIINCTGPESNITRSSNELLSTLAKNGTICPGPFNLGINTDPDGCVISAIGLRKPNLFVVGGNLKGILWESTAVPELRHQAKKMALHILSEINAKRNPEVVG
jgi:uncharacterized NAD(P)/FAD-binding protein YdhS